MKGSLVQSQGKIKLLLIYHTSIFDVLVEFFYEVTTSC